MMVLIDAFLRLSILGLTGVFIYAFSDVCRGAFGKDYVSPRTKQLKLTDRRGVLRPSRSWEAA